MEAIQVMNLIPSDAAMQLKYDYGRLTGHFTDIPPAQRILEKIIKNLQDNLT